MHRTSVKRSIALAATIGVAAIGLAGCSDKGAADSAKSDEKVEISYLHRLPDGPGMTHVADIVKKWNAEHPNIQVTATKFEGKAAEMIKKLETDIKASNGPCLAQLGYAEVPEMFTKGLLMDVTEYAKEYKSNFGGVFEQMAVGGKYVGIPQDAGPLVYVYNKAEFDALGIKAPTTIEEVKSAAATAAAKGKYILDFEPDEAQNWLSAQAVAAAGEAWYSNDGDQWVVDAEGKGSMAVAEMWQHLLDNKLVLTENRWDDGFKNAILEGKLIGTIAAAWEPALIASDLGSTDQVGKWAVAQLPDFGSGMKTGPDGGSGVAVMKGCEHPKQAMEFNNWFNTQVKDLATQVIPAANGSVETPEAQKTFFGGQDIYKEFATANKNVVGFPYIPGFSTLGGAMNKAAAAAATGEGKVIDIFKAAQTTSIKALKDLGLKVKE